MNVSKFKVFKCFYFVNMLGLLQQQVVEQKVLYMYSVYKFKIFNLNTFILKFRINVYKMKKVLSNFIKIKKVRVTATIKYAGF